MSETQLASMRLGSVAASLPETDVRRTKPELELIHITDGQSDEILDVVTARHIIENNHRKSLEDTLETFNFRALGDKPYVGHLEKRNRLIIPDEDGSLVEFIIHEAAKYRDTEGLKVAVYGVASYLDLKKARVIQPISLEGYTASMAVGYALDETEWAPGNIESAGTRTFRIEDHTNPFALLKRIAREFELELNFRVEHDGNRITGRYVDLLERVGEWRGREIEFGRDLIGIRRTEKTENIVTALVGLGPEREDGTRLEVLVTDEEALQRWGRPHPRTGKLQHLIEVYEPQSDRESMTLAELRQYTRTELNKRINAVVEYETTIADLEHVPGMENKKIRFGDTIKIKDTHFNPPLYVEARVYQLDRSITDQSRKEIKLGDYIEYTEDEVFAIWKQLQAQVRRKISAEQLREYAEPKKVVSDTPPTQNENVIWVDTSQEPYVPRVYNFGEWQKLAPTEAIEVGAETPEGAQAKVDAVEIGGRNLLRNSNDFSDWSTFSGATYTTEVLNNGYTRVRTTGGTHVLKVFKLLSDYLPIEEFEGKTITISFDLINYTDKPIVLRGNAISFREKVLEGGFAGRVVLTGRVGNISRQLQFRVVNAEDNLDFGIRQMQLEKGNKATDWSPAPEDVEDQMEDASRLKRGIVDVGAVPLRTSVTGARIEWDGANGLVQYDQNGNPVSWLDLSGNAHFENAYLSGEIHARKGTFAGQLRGASGSFTGEVTGGTIRQIGQAGSITLDNEGFKVFDKNNNLRIATLLTDIGGSHGDVMELRFFAEIDSDRKNPNLAIGHYYVDSYIEAAEFLNLTSEFGTRIRAEDPIEYDSVIGKVALSVSGGALYVASSGMNGGFAFGYGHRISGRGGNATVYFDRTQGDLEIRSHAGRGSYRNDFVIEGGNGTFLSMPTRQNEVTWSGRAAVANNTGRFGFVSSSRRLKLLIEDTKSDHYDLLKVNPRSWYDKKNTEKYAELLHRQAKGEDVSFDEVDYDMIRIPGLVAEEVYDAGLSEFTTFNKDGEVDGVMYDRLWILLIPIVRDLKERIEKLEREIVNAS